MRREKLERTFTEASMHPLKLDSTDYRVYVSCLIVLSLPFTSYVSQYNHLENVPWVAS